MDISHKAQAICMECGGFAERAFRFVSFETTERALAARLVSINVGLPRDITWRGWTIHTGI
jgi:hypothetical protein